MDKGFSNATKTVGVVNKIKTQKHEKLGYKTPAKADGLKGKVVVQVTVDFSIFISES